MNGNNPIPIQVLYVNNLIPLVTSFAIGLKIRALILGRCLVKDYRAANFRKNRMINDREIAECAFSSSVTL